MKIRVMWLGSFREWDDDMKFLLKYLFEREEGVVVFKWLVKVNRSFCYWKIKCLYEICVKVVLGEEIRGERSYILEFWRRLFGCVLEFGYR